VNSTTPILTGELGMGSDGFLADGEVLDKTCGHGSITSTTRRRPSRMRSSRTPAPTRIALAASRSGVEGVAVRPGSSTPATFPASGRGTVRRIVVNDAGNPNASAAGTWVGLEQQPQTIKGVLRLPELAQAYQFWVQADKDGNFTVPGCDHGCEIHALGVRPRPAGTFLSQELAGGKPPLEYTLPAKPHSR